MTLCIAAKFDNNKSLVLMADKQSTNPLHTVHTTDKILKLNDKMYMLVAGDDMLSKQVYEKVKTQDLPTTIDWANSVKNAVAEIRYDKAVDAVLRPRGLTHETYLTAQPGLHREIAQLIDSSLASYRFPRGIEILIAGIDPDDNPKIYYVGSSAITLLEMNVRAAIGSPSQAYFLLNYYEYNAAAGYKKALMDVFKVKKMCESINGINDKTDVVVIQSSGSIKLPASKIAELNGAYQSVKTVSDAAAATALDGITE